MLQPLKKSHEFTVDILTNVWSLVKFADKSAIQFVQSHITSRVEHSWAIQFVQPHRTSRVEHSWAIQFMQPHRTSRVEHSWAIQFVQPHRTSRVEHLWVIQFVQPHRTSRVEHLWVIQFVQPHRTGRVEHSWAIQFVQPHRTCRVEHSWAIQFVQPHRTSRVEHSWAIQFVQPHRTSRVEHSWAIQFVQPHRTSRVEHSWAIQFVQPHRTSRVEHSWSTASGRSCRRLALRRAPGGQSTSLPQRIVYRPPITMESRIKILDFLLTSLCIAVLHMSIASIQRTPMSSFPVWYSPVKPPVNQLDLSKFTQVSASALSHRTARPSNFAMSSLFSLSSKCQQFVIMWPRSHVAVPHVQVLLSW